MPIQQLATVNYAYPAIIFAKNESANQQENFKMAQEMHKKVLEVIMKGHSFADAHPTCCKVNHPDRPCKRPNCCVKQRLCECEEEFLDNVALYTPEKMEKLADDLATMKMHDELKIATPFGSDSVMLTTLLEPKLTVRNIRPETPHTPVWETVATTTINGNVLTESATNAEKHRSKYDALGKLWNLCVKKQPQYMVLLLPCVNIVSVMSDWCIDNKFRQEFAYDGDSQGYMCTVTIAAKRLRFTATGFGRKKVEARDCASRLLFEKLCKDGQMPYAYPPIMRFNAFGLGTVTEWVMKPFSLLKEWVQGCIDGIMTAFSPILEKGVCDGIQTTLGNVLDMLRSAVSACVGVSAFALRGASVGLIVTMLWSLGFFSFTTWTRLLEKALCVFGVRVPEETKFWIEEQTLELSWKFNNLDWEQARTAFKLWVQDYEGKKSTHELTLWLGEAVNHEGPKLVSHFTKYLVKNCPDKGQQWAKLLRTLGGVKKQDFGSCASDAMDAFASWKRDAEGLSPTMYKAYPRWPALRYHGFQLPMEMQDGVKPVLPFMMGVIGALMTGKWPTDAEDMVAFGKNLLMWTSIATAATGVVELASTLLPASVVFWFRKLFQPNAADQPTLDRWLKKSSVLVKHGKNGNNLMNPAFKAYVDMLLEEGAELIFKGVRDSYKQMAIGNYNHLLRIAQSIVSQTSVPPVRIRPFCTWLFGAGGIGKTVAASHLMYEAFKITKKDTTTLVGGSAHWDSVRSDAKGLLMDECLLVQDTEGAVVSSWLTLMSNGEFTPPKAELEAKGVSFGPRAVVCMSNHGYPKVNVSESMPVWRRRDRLVHVKLHPDFANPDGTLNAEKAKAKKTSGNAFPHLRFTLKHPFLNHVSVNRMCVKLSGEEMTYPQLVKHLAASYAQHLQWETELLGSEFAEDEAWETEFNAVSDDVVRATPRRMRMQAAVCQVCESEDTVETVSHLGNKINLCEKCFASKSYAEGTLKIKGKPIGTKQTRTWEFPCGMYVVTTATNIVDCNSHAIVNSVNHKLEHGSGVALAIAEKYPNYRKWSKNNAHKKMTAKIGSVSYYSGKERAIFNMHFPRSDTMTRNRFAYKTYDRLAQLIGQHYKAVGAVVGGAGAFGWDRSEAASCFMHFLKCCWAYGIDKVNVCCLDPETLGWINHALKKLKFKDQRELEREEVRAALGPDWEQLPLDRGSNCDVKSASVEVSAATPAPPPRWRRRSW